jgi:hypothetical protein
MVGSVAAELTIGTSVLKADPEGDMGGIGADGTDGPDFFVRPSEAERLAATASPHIGFFDGQQRTVKHHPAERFIGMVFDQAQKADPHLFHILRPERRHIGPISVVRLDRLPEAALERADGLDRISRVLRLEPEE